MKNKTPELLFTFAYLFNLFIAMIGVYAILNKNILGINCISIALFNSIAIFYLRRREKIVYTHYEKIRNNSIQLVISGLIFVYFSIIMFINTSTNLFVKYDTNNSLSIVTWILLVGSALVLNILILSRGELRRELR